MTDRFAHPDLDCERHKGKRFGTLWMQHGGGDVTLNIDFDGLSPIEKADILSDVLGVLKTEYERSLVALQKQFRRIGA